MEPGATASILALIGALLGIAALFSPVSSRVGIPMLLLFLVIGMGAGSAGLGIAFDDYRLAFRLGTVALVFILFDGALNTQLSVLRRALWPSGLLATVGVVLTAAVLVGIGLLFGLPVGVAVLIAAVVSSTDAAAVFSVLRTGGIRLRSRVKGILEVESGINDPMAVALTFAATAWVAGELELGFGVAASVVLQFVVGTVAGVGVGLAGRALLRLVPLPAAGLYPALTAALALTAFGATSLIGGSGFLAVFVAGVVLSKGHLPHRAVLRRVHDTLAWLSQMLMFLVLGLLVDPSRLAGEALLGIALALALVFVARPAAVLATLAPMSFRWPERLVLSWVGLRGAVPIVLAAYPVLRGVPEAERVFHLVFFVVLVNAIIPGAAVGWVASRLGLARPAPLEPPAGIDLVTARDYAGRFVWYHVKPPAAVVDSLVRDLPLPERCVIVLVVRGDSIVPARGSTRLGSGDHVCVFVDPKERPLLDLLFGLVEDEEG